MNVVSLFSGIGGLDQGLRYMFFIYYFAFMCCAL